MSEVEKTFVIPEPTTPLTKELNTRMNPLSLAIAKETGQLDTVASELQSAFVEVESKSPLRDKHEAYDLSSPRSIKEVLADEDAPDSLKEGIRKTLQDLREGRIHLS
jgi:hypothetical protein